MFKIVRQKKKKKAKPIIEEKPPKKEKIIIKSNLNTLHDPTAILPLEVSDLIKKVSMFKALFLWWKIPAYLRWRKYRKNPHKRVGVNLELDNGHHRIFSVIEVADGFIYRDKKFLFDVQNKYWNIDLNLFFYDFHEQLALPIKREIPTDTILTALEESDITEVAYAINPRTLERFETSKIAEGIMKGQAIDERLKIIILLVGVTIALIAILLVIVAWKLEVFAKTGG